MDKFNHEEFENAFGQFKEMGKPFIYIYFKDGLISTAELNRKDCYIHLFSRIN
jgi:hypothetical protein